MNVRRKRLAAVVVSSAVAFLFALVTSGGASAQPAPAPSGTPLPVAAPAASPAPAAKPAESRNWILSGFYSKHFSMDNQEDDWNTGIFYEHDFNKHWGFEIGDFANSGHIESHLFGATWEPLRTGPFGVGIVAGIVDGYMQLNNGHWSPAGLPYVFLENHNLKGNLFCVPPILKTAPAVCSVQAGINIGDWRY